MRNAVIALAVLAMLIAACAPAGPDGNDAQLPPAPDADDTIVQVQDGDGGDSADDDDGAALDDGRDSRTSGGVKGELETLGRKLESADFKVTYRTSNTYSGESGLLKMYKKSEKTRMDMTTTVEGVTYESQQYMLPDKVVLCQKPEGGWQCLVVESTEQETGLPSDFQSEFEEPDVDIAKAGERTIAGTKAVCYRMETVVPGMGSATYEQCISGEGVLLYMESKTPDGTMKWEATEYSTSVSDSDFTPPATPQSMEEMMQAMMAAYQ